MSLNVEVVKKSKVSPQGALNLPVALRLQTKRNVTRFPPPKKIAIRDGPVVGPLLWARVVGALAISPSIV
jgi:hypothetical protein